MLKPNLKYLKFDDRKMILVGIPLITILIPFMFYGISLPTYLSYFPQEFFDGLLFSSIYAFFVRYLLIVLRKKYEEEKNPLKRLVAQFILIILNTFYFFSPLEDIFQPTTFQSYGVTYFTLLSLMSLYEAIYFFHQYKAAIIEKEQAQQAHLQGQN